MRIPDPSPSLPLVPSSEAKSGAQPAATATPAAATPPAATATPAAATLATATATPALKTDGFENPSLLAGNGGCFPPRPQLPDMSALVALWNLDQSKGSINGDQLAAAIETGVGDLDGKSASEEFRMFSDWAQRNQARLSPEAKQVMELYKQHASAAQLKGQSGIPEPEFKQMIQDMKNVQDVSASAALAKLDQAQGPINGDQLAEAIRTGVEDKDGKGASDEFKQFADWAQKNEKRLSPEAKEVLAIYKKHAQAAQAQGQSGIPDGDFRQMVKEMDSVQDASVAAVLSELDKASGPINGDQLAAAISKGTVDADGKGATDEYKQIADWAKKNEARLSPEAKEVLGIYKKHAEAAQAQGQSGIPLTDFHQMVKEMDAVRDVSATAALAELDKATGPVNGDQLAAAIRKGVEDADGKGSTDEYKLFSDWAQKNESRLSPEAKEVLAIYKKHAEAAQAQGQSGMPQADFTQMVKEMDAVQDASVASALSELDKAKGPVNGDQLAAAIRKGVGDHDGKSATDEYKQFSDWAQKNEARLSPEAKQVLAVYKKYAEGAQAKGQTGMPDADFRKMVKEMNGIKDASATAALAGLDKAQGPINGDQLAAAINKGVGDHDGKSATDEYKQFSDWAKKNEARLSPEAKQVLGIYKKYAEGAQAKGQSGMPDTDFRKMVKEMNAVRDVSATAALAGLDKAQGPINGDQLAAAIRKGVGDHDGKSATDEYKQFADWAKKNEKRLSPEAKQVLGIYKKYAEGAQAKGQSGMPDTDFRKMVKEMSGVRDASATQALVDLSHVRGPVSGRQMLGAIRKGVGDLDGKSATDEFKQFADWAKAHTSKLSPEARKVMATYEKYAKAAQAHGDSGIPLQDYRKMLREMTQALRPVPTTLLARTFAG